MKLKRNYVSLKEFLKNGDVETATIATLFYGYYRYVFDPIIVSLFLKPQLKKINPYSWQERQDFEAQYDVTLID